MLGDLIYEHRGKIMGQRVLDITVQKIETTISSSGKFNGIDVTNLITYWTIPRGQNVLYGESKGVIMTKDGEIGTYRSYGLGGFVSPGKARFRGCAFFNTQSNEKLVFLNNLIGVFEYETDEQGNTLGKVWEWK